MNTIQVCSTLTKGKFVDGVESQDVRTIQACTPTVVALRRERCGCCPEVIGSLADMLGEGVRSHVGEALVKSFLPLQQEAIIPGGTDILIKTHVTQSWVRFGGLQVRVDARWHNVVLITCYQIIAPVPDVGDGQSRIPQQFLLDREVPLVNFIALHIGGSCSDRGGHKL